MRARLPSGAAAGCLVFFGLFCLGLIEATSLSYMGETDDRWVSIVLGRYAGEVAFAQGLLLLTYLACGGVLGAVAALARVGVRPVPLRRMHAVLLDAAIVLLLHGAVLGWGIAHRPTAYAEWLYERGGLRASLHVLAADHLPPWLYLAVPALVGVFALRGLWVSLASPRRRLTVFGGLACLAGAACLAAIVHSPPRLPPPPEDRPHLVILAIDSLRDDRLAPGGPAARLAEVAARGARFERVLVPLARTFPSWVSLLTAQLPVRHGVRHMFPAPGSSGTTPRTSSPAGARASTRSGSPGSTWGPSPACGGSPPTTTSSRTSTRAWGGGPSPT